MEGAVPNPARCGSGPMLPPYALGDGAPSVYEEDWAYMLGLESGASLRSGACDASTCWGYQLLSKCAPCGQAGVLASQSKGSHFRNKFCSMCLDMGLDVPVSCIRALGPELEAVYANKQSSGFWTPYAGNPRSDYRVINQTQRCPGPKLVLFRHEPPLSPEGRPVRWSSLPDGWVVSGAVHLTVSYGTLMPTGRRPRPTTTVDLKRSLNEASGGRPPKHAATGDAASPDTVVAFDPDGGGGPPGGTSTSGLSPPLAAAPQEDGRQGAACGTAPSSAQPPLASATTMPAAPEEGPTPAWAHYMDKLVQVRFASSETPPPPAPPPNLPHRHSPCILRAPVVSPPHSQARAPPATSPSRHRAARYADTLPFPP